MTEFLQLVSGYGYTVYTVYLLLVVGVAGIAAVAIFKGD